MVPVRVRDGDTVWDTEMVGGLGVEVAEKEVQLEVSVSVALSVLNCDRDSVPEADHVGVAESVWTLLLDAVAVGVRVAWDAERSGVKE